MDNAQPHGYARLTWRFDDEGRGEMQFVSAESPGRCFACGQPITWGCAICDKCFDPDQVTIYCRYEDGAWAIYGDLPVMEHDGVDWVPAPRRIAMRSGVASRALIITAYSLAKTVHAINLALTGNIDAAPVH